MRRERFNPAYKKAGFDGVYVYRVRYGDSRNAWSVARVRDSWADLDESEPLSQTIGAQAREELQSLTSRMEWLMLRHRPDLSYAPSE